MKLTPGELVDKWSIVQLKAQADPGIYAGLYDKLTDEVDQLILSHPIPMLRIIAKVVEANTKIWMLEAELRNGNGVNHSVEELIVIGKLAIRIREINKIRVKARETIDTITGNIPDKKYDHLSQDAQDKPEL